MPEERKQIKSRERVRDHGEVFTAEREVKAMCDLVGEHLADTMATTVLEPACGDGNFLAEILERKLDKLENSHYSRGGRAGKWKWQVADLYAFRIATVLTLLYGIDIMPDNVAACRERLFEIALSRFDALVKGKDAASRRLLENAAKTILEINIVCGNALTFRMSDGEPIVFVKWRAEENGDRYGFGITPYYFEKMVDGEGKSRDLFNAHPKLDRSPQIGFREIERVKEHVQT